MTYLLKNPVIFYTKISLITIILMLEKYIIVIILTHINWLFEDYL